MEILRGLLGIGILLSLAYLLSSGKKAIDWKLVGIGMVLQVALAVLIIKVAPVRSAFQLVVDFFILLIGSTEKAAGFMFGSLADKAGPFGFAFYVLPTIIFFSALSSLLYYFGILQKVVYVFAWVMRKTMRMTGAESLAAAANVFIGQTEAPLVVKPYIEKMSRSEILCLMTGGMATIAGSVFGAYMAMLGGSSPEETAKFGMHLLTASIISAPAAIVVAKIILPETEKNRTGQDMHIPSVDAGSNFLDALARGTTDGLKLAVNVGAMLIAFMAIIYLSNELLFVAGKFTGLNSFVQASSNGVYQALSMEYLLGIVFAPIAWVLGVPGKDIVQIGQLLGEKTILNEFVAYASLAKAIPAGLLSEKSIIIATYALCGFANFASIGIQIGGIGAIAPGQRRTLTELGFKALIGGTLAAFLTACIAGAMV
ncbi:MAG: Na+ dependent nucleoside transporter [Saprospiraceae bacterium]|nr:Na+ dependent nucleoside transporter [Saprospiraceae bacterium]MDP4999208.1 Na+ dependent nucleoside transporter [Saprospiraceae bacterium]